MKEAMDVIILPINVLKFKYKPAWWVLLLGFFPEPCRHKICSSEGLINLNCCGRFSFFVKRTRIAYPDIPRDGIYKWDHGDLKVRLEKGKNYRTLTLKRVKEQKQINVRSTKEHNGYQINQANQCSTTERNQYSR